MKQRELTQRLENGGFIFERHGAGHDIYVRGSQRETVPRHKEINEQSLEGMGYYNPSFWE